MDIVLSNAVKYQTHTLKFFFLNPSVLKVTSNKTGVELRSVKNEQELFYFCVTSREEEEDEEFNKMMMTTFSECLRSDHVTSALIM